MFFRFNFYFLINFFMNVNLIRMAASETTLHIYVEKYLISVENEFIGFD